MGRALRARQRMEAYWSIEIEVEIGLEGSFRNSRARHAKDAKDGKDEKDGRAGRQSVFFCTR